MIRPNRYPRAATAPAAVLLLALMTTLSMLAGCGEESPTAPGPGNDPAEAPVLPDPGFFDIDLGFFDSAEEKTVGRANFYNAYLRAVIVTSVTRLVLVPPIAAFSLALHTVPTPQPDGSWIWVYTYVRDSHEVQIRLRGEARDGGGTDWALRVTAPRDGIENALWFDGHTQHAGRSGQWTFYDINLPDPPAAAEVSWHDDADGHELRLEALHGDIAGDVLAFTVVGDIHRIDYDDADADSVWFIRWNETDNTGSLQVPDYRNGVESCWDEELFDVECGD